MEPGVTKPAALVYGDKLLIFFLYAFVTCLDVNMMNHMKPYEALWLGDETETFPEPP